jgi:AraC-like DNA-binding protein
VDYRIQLVLAIIEQRKDGNHLQSRFWNGLLGLSDAHLHRLFKRDVGTALGRYVLKARMVGAAELLEDCSLPIKEIAVKCGYDDLSNFYRDFRKVHETTPKQYRTRRFGQHIDGSGWTASLD